MQVSAPVSLVAGDTRLLRRLPQRPYSLCSLPSCVPGSSRWRARSGKGIRACPGSRIGARYCPCEPSASRWQQKPGRRDRALSLSGPSCSQRAAGGGWRYFVSATGLAPGRAHPRPSR